MADISQVTVKGTSYNLKDAQARTDVSKALTDISALSTLLSGALVYKGTLANYDEIQANPGLVKGDVYTAADTGLEYAWNGSEWFELGAVNQITVDDELSSTSDNPVKNRVIKSNLDMLNALLPPFPSSDYNGMVLTASNGEWVFTNANAAGLTATVSGETLVIG